MNPETPDLNRAEIVALHLMPAHLPVARLLGSYDDGDWVALVLEDVEGRRPSLPWTCADVTSVTATLRAVAGTTAPEELPAFADVVLALSAWDDVAADPSGPSRAGLTLTHTWARRPSPRTWTARTCALCWPASSGSGPSVPDDRGHGAADHPRLAVPLRGRGAALAGRRCPVAVTEQPAVDSGPAGVIRRGRSHRSLTQRLPGSTWTVA